MSRRADIDVLTALEYLANLSPDRIRALYAIAKECERGERKHGNTFAEAPDGTGEWARSEVNVLQALHDAAVKDGTVTRAAVFLEEVAEAMAETSDEPLESELVQVASVAVRWVERIARRFVS